MQVKQNLTDAWKNSFNSVAKLYDRRRPGYPSDLFERVISYAKLGAESKALEVGAGTGIATIEFGKRGFNIEAVELGPEMAQVAQKKCEGLPNVRFCVGAFEAFEGLSGSYDLIYSAQAFHWIDPKVRYVKTHQLLKPEGALALFWNMAPEGSADPLRRELEGHYKKYAPHMVNWGRKKSFDETVEEGRQEILESKLFEQVEVVQFPVKVNRYTADQYLELLGTYSDHINLEKEASDKLLAAIHNSIVTAGGEIEDRRVAVLYLAKATG